ncbi:hypothetical protein Tco_0692508 [Tanacetum coccineum]
MPMYLVRMNLVPARFFGSWLDNSSIFRKSQSIRCFKLQVQLGSPLDASQCSLPEGIKSILELYLANWKADQLITSSGWLLALAVLAQMAYLVANITFASTRSDVMEITSLAQREFGDMFVAIVGLLRQLLYASESLLFVVEKFSCRQTFICCHSRLALEYVWLLDPLAFELC